MRILVCGSRDWTNVETIREKLSNFPLNSTVIHGGCRGADTIAAEIAKSLGFDVLCFNADWKKHGKAAGPLRNQKMLEEGKPDIVLAFHADVASSRGTRDMVERAKKSGLKVELIDGAKIFVVET